MKKTKNKKKRVIRHSVTFDAVEIRRYTMIIGDHPCVSMGTPVQLGWEYEEDEYDDGIPMLKINIDEYEMIRNKTRRKTLRQLILNYYQRQYILTRLGYTEQEQNDAAKEASKIKRQRSITTTFGIPIMSKIEEIIQSVQRKIKRRIKTKRRQVSGKGKPSQSNSVVHTSVIPNLSKTKRG